MKNRGLFRRPFEGPTPTPAEIDRALDDCAKLIDLGYEALLPYFEVLEQLLSESHAREAILARARKRAVRLPTT